MSETNDDIPLARIHVPRQTLGAHLNRAFAMYGATWDSWLLPMLVCGLIAVLSYGAGILPFFIVQCPLACGLYACALAVLRGGSLEWSLVGRGWQTLGPAVLTGLVTAAVQMVPFVLLLLTWLTWAAWGVQAGIGQRGEIPALAMIVTLVAMLGMFVWIPFMYWFSTRTMFVLPLIVDRNYDFRTAWHASWETTRDGFWDLLILHVVGLILGTLGMNLCLIGGIFSMPLHFLLVSLVYEERFGRPA